MIIVYTWCYICYCCCFCSFVGSEQQLEPPVKKAKVVNTKSKDECTGKGKEKAKDKLKKKGIVL